MKNAREIIEKLGGSWRGDHGRSYCPAHQSEGKKGADSLAIKQAEGRVLFKCFAGCSYQKIKAALSGFVFENKTPKIKNIKKFDSTKKAFEILNRSAPIVGTIAEKYLREIRGLYHFDNTNDLRFHSDVWHSREYGSAPAMIAAIRDIQNWEVIGCHVTFLAKNGEKAPFSKVKKFYGEGAGKGVIVLRVAQPNAAAIIAEGIENALSLDLFLAKDYSVVSCLNCNGLAEFHKANVRFSRTVIAGDKDEAGIKSAEYFAHFWRKKNKKCVIMYPPDAADWNDQILQKF